MTWPATLVSSARSVVSSIKYVCTETARKLFYLVLDVANEYGCGRKLENCRSWD